MANKKQDETIEHDSPPPAVGIGRLLSEARERKGEDIATVSQTLRIRQPYLVAMEGGRYDELPGSAYAIGFVRAYADYLELDGEEVVRRFKEESAGNLSRDKQLHFPTPVSESHVPGGAVLFVGLFLAAIAYGAWYYVSSQEDLVADMVPAIPERFAALVGKVTNTDEPPPPAAVVLPEAALQAENPQAENPRAETPQAENSQTEATGGEEQLAADGTAPQPAEPEAETVPPAETEQAEVQKPAAAPEPKPVKAEVKKPEPKPVAEAVKPAPQPAAPEPKVEPVQDVAKKPEPAPAPVAEASADPEAEEVVAGRVYGESGGNRVMLNATADAWVQISDGEGKTVFARLLKSGDAYAVPSQPGLVLMTGNAGALKIAVDGKAIAGLGAFGAVRRNIALDPESLVNR